MNIVTLTQYGFLKDSISLKNNVDLNCILKDLCKSKNPNLIYSEELIENLSKLFSGDEKINELIKLEKIK